MAWKYFEYVCSNIKTVDVHNTELLLLTLLEKINLNTIQFRSLYIVTIYSLR